jgi:hypothetical protein
MELAPATVGDFQAEVFRGAACAATWSPNCVEETALCTGPLCVERQQRNPSPVTGCRRACVCEHVLGSWWCPLCVSCLMNQTAASQALASLALRATGRVRRNPSPSGTASGERSQPSVSVSGHRRPVCGFVPNLVND